MLEQENKRWKGKEVEEGWRRDRPPADNPKDMPGNRSGSPASTAARFKAKHNNAGTDASRASLSNSFAALPAQDAARAYGHIGRMSTLSAVARERFLYATPSSAQYQHAKKMLNAADRDHVALVLQNLIRGQQDARLQALTVDDALTMWLSVQHARLTTHSEEQRRNYRKQRLGKLVPAMLLSVSILGIGKANKIRKSMKWERTCYYDSMDRPEYTRAFTAFLKMLASTSVKPEHKLRIAGTLLDLHMAKEGTISQPDLAMVNKFIDGYLKREQHAFSFNVPSSSGSVSTPAQAIIAFASDPDMQRLRRGTIAEEEARRKRAQALALTLGQGHRPPARWNRSISAPPVGNRLTPLGSYKRKGFHSLNRELRRGRVRDSALQLSQALQERSMYGFYGLTYRGIFPWNTSFVQMPFMQEYATWSDPAFLSATADPAVAQYYTYNKVVVEQMVEFPEWRMFGTMLHIIGRSGVDLTSSNHEREVLFDRNASFDVLFNGFDSQDKIFKVVLRERKDEIPRGTGAHDNLALFTLSTTHDARLKTQRSHKNDLRMKQASLIRRFLDVANAHSSSTATAPPDELNVHLAMALTHLSRERLLDILVDHLVMRPHADMATTAGTSKPLNRNRNKALSSARAELAERFPKARYWKFDGLPKDIVASMQAAMAVKQKDFKKEVDEFVVQLKALNPKLGFDAVTLKTRINQMLLDVLTSPGSSVANRAAAKIVESQIKTGLSGVLKKLEKASYIPITAPDIDWKNPLLRHTYQNADLILEKIVKDRNQVLQESPQPLDATADQIPNRTRKPVSDKQLAIWMRQIRRLINPFVNPAELTKYILKGYTLDEPAIERLNQAFRVELRPFYASFESRYSRDAIDDLSASSGSAPDEPREEFLQSMMTETDNYLLSLLRNGGSTADSVLPTSNGEHEGGFPAPESENPPSARRKRRKSI